MADQRVIYKQGSEVTGDSGAREDIEAIKPYDNGEVLDETVFNRSPENLRQRTEVARTALEDLKYRIDHTYKWIITSRASTPGVLPRVLAWDKDTGIFDMDVPAFVPLGSPQANKQTEHVWDFEDVATNTGSITWVALVRGPLGGDTLEVHLEYDAVNPDILEVTVSGDPVYGVKVLVSSDGSVGLDDVYEALTVGATAAEIATIFSVTNNWPGVAPAVESAGTVPTAGLYDCLDTVEMERFEVTQDFDSITLAHPLLLDGDMLGIWFEQPSPPSAYMDKDHVANDGRRLRGYDPVITEPEFFLASEHPERIPLCIPVCRRVNDALYFIDGTIVDHNPADTGVPIYLGESSKTVARVDHIANTERWADLEFLNKDVADKEYTAKTFLNTIMEELAEVTDTSNSGVTRIGIPAMTDPSPDVATPIGYAAGPLVDAMGEILMALNQKPAVGDAETITGSWTFDVVTTFNAAILVPQIKANGTQTQAVIESPVLQDTSAGHEPWLLFETTHLGGTDEISRIYYSRIGIATTFNCFWTGTEWQRDNSNTAYAHVVGRGLGNTYSPGIRYYIGPDLATWGDTQWLAHFTTASTHVAYGARLQPYLASGDEWGFETVVSGTGAVVPEAVPVTRFLYGTIPFPVQLTNVSSYANLRVIVKELLGSAEVTTVAIDDDLTIINASEAGCLVQLGLISGSSTGPTLYGRVAYRVLVWNDPPP